MLNIILTISILTMAILFAIYWYIRTVWVEKWKATFKTNMGGYKKYPIFRMIGKKWFLENSWIFENFRFSYMSSRSRIWFFKHVIDLNIAKDIMKTNFSLVNSDNAVDEFFGYSPHAQHYDVWQSISLNPHLGEHIFKFEVYGNRLNWKCINVYKRIPPSYLYKYKDMPDFSWEKVARFTELIREYFDSPFNGPLLQRELSKYAAELASNENISPTELHNIFKLAAFSNKIVKKKVIKEGVFDKLPDDAVSITDEIFKVGDGLWIKCEGGYCKDS